jgi:hypothetical protein
MRNFAGAGDDDKRDSQIQKPLSVVEKFPSGCRHTWGTLSHHGRAWNARVFRHSGAKSRHHFFGEKTHGL